MNYPAAKIKAIEAAIPESPHTLPHGYEHAPASTQNQGLRQAQPER
jgi:hypothetical protein